MGLWNSANRATIMGQAYRNTPSLDALEEHDPPAVGFQVELYRIVACSDDLLVGKSVVDEDGIYRFSVPIGERPEQYYVEPVMKIPGYLGWKDIVFLKSQPILVEERGTYPGPTLLLSGG